jgi:hypothetical protein
MKAAKTASQIKRFVRLFGGHVSKNSQVFLFQTHSKIGVGRLRMGSLGKFW